MISNLAKVGALSVVFATISSVASAQTGATGVSPEVSYIFNTFLFLVAGFLVMFMAAGFAMLEAGMVRSQSVVAILLKNVTLYALAGVMFLLVGYNLMYMDVGSYMGTFAIWSPDSGGIENGDFSAGYSSSADWFFQMVFVATTASIVSGTLAERIRVTPFLVFVAILAGFMYPITGAWKWGGGWLDELGFQDFAGSTLVHSVGGWAALVGVLFLGSRVGRFVNGEAQNMPASSLPLVTLGTFILWLGWFGFNGGSQLALGSGIDADAVARIFINTNMGAAGGLLTVYIVTRVLKGANLSLVLNGALGGLVSITAEPLAPNPLVALLIGSVGGLLVIYTTAFMERIEIDDVVGAIPVHLVCGIWGTMIVPLTNPDASYLNQLIGVAAIGGFTVVCSTVAWFVIKKLSIHGIRISDEAQINGQDLHEFGTHAYPEFTSIQKPAK